MHKLSQIMKKSSRLMIFVFLTLYTFYSHSEDLKLSKPSSVGPCESAIKILTQRHLVKSPPELAPSLTDELALLKLGSFRTPDDLILKIPVDSAVKKVIIASLRRIEDAINSKDPPMINEAIDAFISTAANLHKAPQSSVFDFLNEMVQTIKLLSKDNYKSILNLIRSKQPIAESFGSASKGNQELIALLTQVQAAYWVKVNDYLSSLELSIYSLSLQSGFMHSLEGFYELTSLNKKRAVMAGYKRNLINQWLSFSGSSFNTIARSTEDSTEIISLVAVPLRPEFNRWLQAMRNRNVTVVFDIDEGGSFGGYWNESDRRLAIAFTTILDSRITGVTKHEVNHYAIDELSQRGDSFFRFDVSLTKKGMDSGKLLPGPYAGHSISAHDSYSTYLNSTELYTNSVDLQEHSRNFFNSATDELRRYYAVLFYLDARHSRFLANRLSLVSQDVIGKPSSWLNKQSSEIGILSSSSRGEYHGFIYPDPKGSENFNGLGLRVKECNGSKECLEIFIVDGERHIGDTIQDAKLLALTKTYIPKSDSYYDQGLKPRQVESLTKIVTIIERVLNIQHQNHLTAKGMFMELERAAREYLNAPSATTQKRLEKLMRDFKRPKIYRLNSH